MKERGSKGGGGGEGRGEQRRRKRGAKEEEGVKEGGRESKGGGRGWEQRRRGAKDRGRVENRIIDSQKVFFVIQHPPPLKLEGKISFTMDVPRYRQTQHN